MRWVVITLLVVLAASGSVRGQTTRPAPESWTAVVDQFALALTQSDAAALVPLLAENGSIQSFDTKSGDAVRLLARTRKGTLVSARAYFHAPAKLASDLAEQFKGAEVPEELKKQMGLRDEAHGRKANQTAAQWVGSAVGAREGDLVGVLAFYCERELEEAAIGEVVFVLVKGEFAGEQPPKIHTIAFGNPQRQTK